MTIKTSTGTLFANYHAWNDRLSKFTSQQSVCSTSYNQFTCNDMSKYEFKWVPVISCSIAALSSYIWTLTIVNVAETAEHAQVS